MLLLLEGIPQRGDADALMRSIRTAAQEAWTIEAGRTGAVIGVQGEAVPSPCRRQRRTARKLDRVCISAPFALKASAPGLYAQAKPPAMGTPARAARLS